MEWNHRHSDKGAGYGDKRMELEREGHEKRCYINNPHDVSLDYALFRSINLKHDNNMAYNNIFDATVDAFVYAMVREGFEGIPVVVTETGWPTVGGEAASVENALDYNGNVARRALSDPVSRRNCMRGTMAGRRLWSKAPEEGWYELDNIVAAWEDESLIVSATPSI
ncbi:unnamed protein product [Ilex paraguariensis]|uniref:Glucan endo-1,3-beta-D-glucosidase n=1 Tax=Ilex paraguariensis TaxID=185542 RepID=A0ABC8S0U4_9AQUA